MYAIVEEGSRQHRVEAGSVLHLDERPAEVGQRIELTRVLLLRDETGAVVGQPLVEGAKVVVEVLGEDRVKTVTQKFRRRKASKRLKGHTQRYVRVKVVEIVKPGDGPATSS
jgi:large subunit ribosomal protein L21